MVAAVGSWLDARARGGKWYVRIDDLDAPRVVPGSIRSILSTLEGFGLEWDGEVAYQSDQFDAYRAALVDLTQRGLTLIVPVLGRIWEAPKFTPVRAEMHRVFFPVRFVLGPPEASYPGLTAG
jgi:hypothetical protein